MPGPRGSCAAACKGWVKREKRPMEWRKAPVGALRCIRLSTGRSLLQLDAGAGLLELCLERVGLVLGDALLDRLRGRVDEVLRLLEAESGDRAHDLDHLDLLLAGAGEDDVEGRLLLR